jgi:hypothetical protein
MGILRVSDGRRNDIIGHADSLSTFYSIVSDDRSVFPTLGQGSPNDFVQNQRPSELTVWAASAPAVHDLAGGRLSWLRQRAGLLTRPTGGYSQWRFRGQVATLVRWRTDVSCAPRLTLEYLLAGADSEPDHFPLVSTSPHLGGVRWWILCRCGRRVAQLCLPRGASRFRCRHCYRLAYQCQREKPEWRAYRRVDKIATRLSPEWAKDLVPADVLDGVFLPPKPKWMRWRTYDRLSAESVEYARRHQIGAVAAFNRLIKRR